MLLKGRGHGTRSEANNTRWQTVAKNVFPLLFSPTKSVKSAISWSADLNGPRFETCTRILMCIPYIRRVKNGGLSNHEGLSTL